MTPPAELFAASEVASDSPTCRCGCGQSATWLISGTDFGGDQYVDDPACQSAADYCEEAASELGLNFSRKKLTP